MSDRPDPADLLDTARTAVLDELLPRLPGEAQYTARMVAHALGIAARALAAPALAGELRRALADLAAEDDDGSDAALSRIAVAIAQRLRRGDFTHAAFARASLHAALVEWTAARLAIADPRAGARGAPR